MPPQYVKVKPRAPGEAPGGLLNHPNPRIRSLVAHLFDEKSNDLAPTPPVKSFDMAYVAPIHRPSSIRHAIKLNFLEPNEECLILAKSNKLEIYVHAEGKLVCRHSKTVYGQIVMLEKLCPAASPTDHLFIGTDRFAYFTVSWDASTRQLKTERSYVDLAEKGGRDSESNDRCFIDPLRRYLTLELFEGVYTVIPIYWKQPKLGANQQPVEIRNLSEEVLPIRIPEILVRSSTYLHYRSKRDRELEKEKPRIATLYEDNLQRAFLKIRELVPNKELDYAELENEKVLLRDKLDPSASHLIPVPNPINGVLILSETCVTWVDDEDASKVYALEEATIWVAWTQVDEFRWLLADEFGFLYFLMLLRDEEEEQLTGFELHKLGKASRASTLVSLGGPFVFIGSHSGDSQLVKIREHGVEVLQTLDNIGPILDFTIMDMGSRGGDGQINEYSSGQARLVTASGAYQDGSLRSIRSGVGVTEFGSLDLYPDGTATARVATDMFHIAVSNGSGSDDLLLVSYVYETRILYFNPEGEVEEVQYMVTNEPTILAQKVSSSEQLGHERIVQCTSGSVTVYSANIQDLKLLAHWRVPGDQKIIAATASEECIVVSLGGTELVSLDISERATQNAELRELGRRAFNNQVSCIDIPNIAPRFVLAGFWQSNDLVIYALPDLTEVHTTPVSDNPTAVPRSVLLTQVIQDQHPTLFISLADGHVVTFDFDPSTFALTGYQSTILGTQPANLKILPRKNNLCSVFAIAEHSTLIYGADNRLIYSAVTAEDATCICSFDSQAYPEAVAIATPRELKIAYVERERTTHVQTLHVGETVRRIAYSPELRAFGIGTIKRTLVANAEVIQSYFRLADEINFKILSEHALNEEEVVESVCRMDINENGKLVERFVVGTAYLDCDDDPDKGRGRIVVFEVTEDRMLKVVTEVKTKGSCRALSVVDGKIVAALVKTVVIFAYEFSALQKRCAYRTSTAPIDVFVTGDLIVVADLMKSCSIIRYIPGQAGGPDKLEEVARHFPIVWSTAIAPVDEHTILESDSEGNLILLKQNVSGVTAEDQRRLETISEMSLGEMVNKMRPINVAASPNAVVVPRAFLGTVVGSIYVFGLINPNKQNLLMNLQSNISKHVKSPGDYPWEQWRAYRNPVREEREPLRFVDGELVERFLDCDRETQESIVQGLEATVDEVSIMVESLRRMH